MAGGAYSSLRMIVAGPLNPFPVLCCSGDIAVTNLDNFPFVGSGAKISLISSIKRSLN